MQDAPPLPRGLVLSRRSQGSTRSRTRRHGSFVVNSLCMKPNSRVGRVQGSISPRIGCSTTWAFSGEQDAGRGDFPGQTGPLLSGGLRAVPDPGLSEPQSPRL